MPASVAIRVLKATLFVPAEKSSFASFIPEESCLATESALLFALGESDITDNGFGSASHTIAIPNSGSIARIDHRVHGPHNS